MLGLRGLPEWLIAFPLPLRWHAGAEVAGAECLGTISAPWQQEGISLLSRGWWEEEGQLWQGRYFM